MNDNFLEIRALGRECYLGQLYDAKSSTLLPGFSLYKADDIKPRKTDVSNTDFTYKQVNSFSDRATTLGISAQLSVTIMGGAISIGGWGSYLNSKQDTSESTTIALIAKYRTNSQSLDFVGLKNKMAMPAEALAKTRATHVVTSITFGGNVIGTLSQQSSNKNDSTSIKGSFSLEAFKGLGKAFSAKGKAELSMEEREKLNSFNLLVDLKADIKLGDVPTDPIAMLELIKKSATLVGDGVPCEVRLTPLAMLFSDVPSCRDLADADLIDISNVYDKILKLESSRIWLSTAVEAHNELFPTFFAGIRTRTDNVTKLVQQARDNLREYLHKYRSASSEDVVAAVESPGEFIAAINGAFTGALKEYEDDLEEWRRYQDRLAAAERHGFPVIGVSAVGGKMNHADKSMLSAILVPHDANWEALMNLYGDLAIDIRQWRKSIDKVPDEKDAEGSLTEFVSIYADPSRDATYKSLDDKAGTLKNALESARETKRAVFLTYGRSRSHLGGFVWNVLNQEGWGVMVNEAENWRYVGDVHLSKPHGSGIMTYANKTKYVGSFVQGYRDGLGEIFDAEGKATVSGVFISNAFAPFGSMVEVTVVNKDGIPVQYESVALNVTGDARTHVDRIGTVMGWGKTQQFRLVLEEGAAQVDRIEAVLGKEEAQRLLQVPEDRNTQVDVIGCQIEPNAAPTKEISWERFLFHVKPRITAYVR